MLVLPKHVTDKGVRVPFSDDMIKSFDAGIKTETRRPVRYTGKGQLEKCLCGKPGDLLLITGSHILVDVNGKIVGSDQKQDRHHAIYRVDVNWDYTAVDKEWRPPMFMPKWTPTRVARNVSVSVEHLHEITSEQALNEGIREIRQKEGPFIMGYHWRIGVPESQLFETPMDAYVSLWNEIHEDRGLFFGTNPEVWRIVFEPVDVSSL